MQIEKYTDRLKTLVQAAQDLALRSGHQQITPLHVLRGLLDGEDRLAANLIEASGGVARAIDLAVGRDLRRLPKVAGSGARCQVMDVVGRSFQPKSLDRINEIILFNRLDRNEMRRLVDIQLKDLQQLLDGRKITLIVDDKVKTWLADTGYDPVYGARPLRRVIQRRLQDPLATMLLTGAIGNGETVRVTVKDGQLATNGKRLERAA